jgi:hypothetical protein
MPEGPFGGTANRTSECGPPGWWNPRVRRRLNSSHPPTTIGTIYVPAHLPTAYGPKARATSRRRLSCPNAKRADDGHLRSRRVSDESDRHRVRGLAGPGSDGERIRQLAARSGSQPPQGVSLGALTPLFRANQGTHGTDSRECSVHEPPAASASGKRPRRGFPVGPAATRSSSPRARTAARRRIRNRGLDPAKAGLGTAAPFSPR